MIMISKEEGGVEYTESMIKRYREKAIESIPEDITDEYRNALTAYVDYVISREK